MNTYHNRNLSEYERFFSFIYFEPMSGCWLWGGSVFGNGYGYFRRSKGRGISSHRYSFEIHKGPIPIGAHVLHTCDTPACCNPDHLIVGTHQENMKHRDETGRQAKGNLIRTTKLTEEQVLEMRSLYAKGIQQKELAYKYGIHPSQISRILNMKYWKYLQQTTNLADLAGFNQSRHELRTILREIPA